MPLVSHVLRGLCIIATGAVAAGSTTTATAEACAQTALTVPNGDFESGQLEPWISGGTNASVSLISPGYQGQYAAEFQLTGKETDYYIYQRANACTTTQYQLDFAYRITGSAPYCDLTVFAFAMNDGTTGQVELPLADTGGWKTASTQFQLVNSPEYEISVTIECDNSPTQENATVDVDSFVLSDVGSLIPPGCPKEVSLTNGDFESGSLGPWDLQLFEGDSSTAGSEAGVVTPGYNGSECMFRIDFAEHHYRDRAEFILSQSVYNACLDSSYDYGVSYRWIGNTTALAARSASLAFFIRDCDTGSTCGNFANALQGWQNLACSCEARNSSTSSGPQDLEFVLMIDYGIVAGVIPPFSIEVDDAWVRLAE